MSESERFAHMFGLITNLRYDMLHHSNLLPHNQLFHNTVLEEGPCQLQMGLTQLQEGSVWNTMPPHTHGRRIEAYYYFNLPEGHQISHVMGEPQETRIVWLKNEQAIMSPEWSIHCPNTQPRYRTKKEPSKYTRRFI